ncbi:MAG: hypothetical protein RR315_01645 [Oscillospiraceae bacterium]
MDLFDSSKRDALSIFEIVMTEYKSGINNKLVAIIGEDEIIPALTELFQSESAVITEKLCENIDILIAFENIPFDMVESCLKQGGFFVLCGKGAFAFITSAKFKSIRILRLDSGRKFI